MSNERRETPRVPVSMKVDCPGDNALAFGYAENISLKGMAVDAQIWLSQNTSPQAGELLHVKFMLPGSQIALSLEAHVLRIDKTPTQRVMVALSFKNLSELAQREITYFVDHISTS